MNGISEMVRQNQLLKMMTDQSHDQMILDVLIRLGGKFAGRVMELRRHLPMPIREAQIIRTSHKREDVADYSQQQPRPAVSDMDFDSDIPF